MKKIVSLLFLLALWVGAVQAHPFQVEPVVIELRPQASFINAIFRGNVQDIEQIPGFTQPMLDNSTMQSKARLGDKYNDEFQRSVTDYINERFMLSRGSEKLVGKLEELRNEPGADITKARFTLVLRYEQPESVRDQPLQVVNTLFDYLPNAQVVVTVGSFSRTMKPGDDVSIDPNNLAANLLSNIWSFLVLGAEHIFTGPDHVLFILALLMVSTSLPNLIKTLTGFTIAHSITLVWVTLSGQGPPMKIVDILVAISIIYVGAENLFMKTEDTPTPETGKAEAATPGKKPGFTLTPKHRFWVASTFGLIHGFAFAQNLRDAGLPEGAALVWSLFSFNLGVEVAQVMLAAVAFPLLMLWKKDVIRRQKYGGMKWDTVVKVASLGVVIAGGYWLTQRLFGG
jgi:hydrogenase/urease accessory protein HupE